MDATAGAAGSTGLEALQTPQGIVFLVLAAGIVGMSIFCMTRRNPVTAVMSLVATFFGLAALYATLSAHFIAVLQVLVYAGAIMVLFIFVVMILNREESTAVSLRGIFTRGLGVIAAIYLTLVFSQAAILEGTGPAARPVATVPDTFGTVASVGEVLFRQFVFPFESISLLLLVAIAGGVVVSRSHRKEMDAVRAAEQRKAIAQLRGPDSPAGDDEDGADHGHGGGGHAVAGGGH